LNYILPQKDQNFLFSLSDKSGHDRKMVGSGAVDILWNLGGKTF